MPCLFQCSVKVKMLNFLDEPHRLHTKFGHNLMRTAIVADKTKAMKLPLWGNNIQKLESAKFYALGHLITNTFSGNIQLSTTSNTTFDTIKEFDDVNDDLTNLEEITEFSGSVQTCKITEQAKCLSCNKPLHIGNEEALIKCPSCSSKQRLASLKKLKTAHITVVDNHEVTKKFVIFDDVLTTYSTKNSLLDLSITDIEDTLLLSNSITIKHHKNSDVVTDII